jgi:hypothetical protein
MATIPLVSPEGVSQAIPAERLMDALGRGFRIPGGYTLVTSPAGETQALPFAQAAQAFRNGFKSGPAWQQQSAAGSGAPQDVLTMYRDGGGQRSAPAVSPDPGQIGRSLLRQNPFLLKTPPSLTRLDESTQLANQALGGTGLSVSPPRVPDPLRMAAIDQMLSEGRLNAFSTAPPSQAGGPGNQGPDMDRFGALRAFGGASESPGQRLTQVPAVPSGGEPQNSSAAAGAAAPHRSTLDLAREDAQKYHRLLFQLINDPAHARGERMFNAFGNGFDSTLGYINDSIVTPFVQANEGLKYSLADAGHQFSKPLPPNTGDPRATTLVRANDLVGRTVDLGGDATNIAFAPVSVPLAPVLNPTVGPWLTAATNFLKLGAGGQVKPEVAAANDVPDVIPGDFYWRNLATPGGVTTGNKNVDKVYDLVPQILMLKAGGRAKMGPEPGGLVPGRGGPGPRMPWAPRGPEPAPGEPGAPPAGEAPLQAGPAGAKPAVPIGDVVPEEAVRSEEPVKQAGKAEHLVPLSELVNNLDLAEKLFDELPEPNVVGGDKVKELHPGWENKEARADLNEVIRRDAAKIARGIFERKAQRLQERSRVRLVAGPVAAGKSTLLKIDPAQLNYEVNLSDLGNARRLLDSLLERGLAPEVRYVYQTPELSAVRRGTRMMEDGRPVELYRTTDHHIVLPKNIAQLGKEYAGRVKFEAFENTGDSPVPIPLESVEGRAYTKGDYELLREQQAALSQSLAEGNIDRRTFEVLTRNLRIR